MSIWRRMTNRLSSLLRGRHLVRILAPVVVLLLVAGCSRGLRQESWPGMIAVGDTLYAANLEQVQALNAQTGKVYWGFPTTVDPKVGPFYSAPVLAPDVGANGLLLIAGYTDHTVYALSLGASTTEVPDVLWQFSGAGSQYVGTGTVASNLFIIGNGDGKVYALHLEDGTEAWTFSTGDRVWGTPVVIDNTVYVASLDHHVYALDLQTGAKQDRKSVV